MVTVVLYAGGVVLFLLALLASIGLHEMGHLYYAKRYGCRVPQYMIGFGKTLWSRTIGETEYGLKMLPLGGYVRIIGMMPPRAAKPGRRTARDTDPIDSTSPVNQRLFSRMISETRANDARLVTPEDVEQNRVLYKLPWHRKAMVMFAGPAVNIVIAFCCFLGVFAIYGVHVTTPVEHSTVLAGVPRCVLPASRSSAACGTGQVRPGPAYAAGLRAGDRVTAVDGVPVATWTQLARRLDAHAGARVSVAVERGGSRLVLHPRLLREHDGSGFVGIEPKTIVIVQRHGLFYTMSQVGQMTATSVRSIFSLPARVWNVSEAIVGAASRDQDGPVSIIGGSRFAGEVVSARPTELDLGAKVAFLVVLVGSFNLFIGLFNLIPLLPLDGGHIVGALWEGIRRRLYLWRRGSDPGYVDVARQMPFAYCIAMVLLVMGVVLMIGDLVVPLKMGL